MTVIDERGRLFGRVNLIDAFIAAVVLLAIPLAYGAYVLFRPQPVVLKSVDPNRIPAEQSRRVTIQGEHFRPFLRAQVGAHQPLSFLVATSTTGEAVLPALAPGTYDFALYSEAQEVARLRGAITVTASAEKPPFTVQIVGALVGLDEARVREVTPGRRLPDAANPFAEVVEARPARADVRRVQAGNLVMLAPVRGSLQVPATLRVPCVIEELAQRCRVGSLQIEAGHVLPIPGWGDFAIYEIRPDAPPVSGEIGVRFVGAPEIVQAIRLGDRDQHPGGEERAAAIVALGAKQILSAERAVRVLGPEGVIDERRVADRAGAVDATLRLSLDDSQQGALYRSRPVKLGAAFILETREYVARGTITRVATPQPAAVHSP
jgi:hypothetical protein